MTKPTKQKSWRDELPVHPVADLFPAMTDDELAELAADIEKHGVRIPVTVWIDRETGKQQLLDGRNRYEANGRLGRHWHEVPHEEVPKDTDPYEYVLSANVHRRHLTVAQKRKIVAAVLKAQPEKSDRQIAKQAKVAPTTVGKERRKQEQTGTVSKLDTRTGADGVKQPSTKPTSTTTKVRVVPEPGGLATAVRRVTVKADTPKPEAFVGWVRSRTENVAEVTKWLGEIKPDELGAEATAALDKLATVALELWNTASSLTETKEEQEQ